VSMTRTTITAIAIPDQGAAIRREGRVSASACHAPKGRRMSAAVSLGYPLRRWGVAANRRPVHEVSSRNRWDEPFGAAGAEADVASGSEAP
jgi:hypothetical protein